MAMEFSEKTANNNSKYNYDDEINTAKYTNSNYTAEYSLNYPSKCMLQYGQMNEYVHTNYAN